MTRDRYGEPIQPELDDDTDQEAPVTEADVAKQHLADMRKTLNAKKPA